MKKSALLLLLGLYLSSAAISFMAFSYLGKGNSLAVQTQNEQLAEGETLLTELLSVDPNAKKDQACPLNGEYYTQVEREAWEARRPLAVMIENHTDARPQSGLADADIVFEAIAEGGVTRFMAIYYCAAQRYEITVAPVRSARTYFVDWASGFNRPLYAHVGGANLPGPADALGQISQYGWNQENDLNQFSIGYPTFVRDYNRVDGKEIATEHTMVSSTELLWEIGAERGWTNISPLTDEDWADEYQPWSFQDEQPTPGDVREISHEFWSGYDEYSVSWKYDETTNRYQRFLGGQPHIDLNTNEQIQAANVIVLLTTEKGPIDEKKHLLYGTTGSGDALLFKNGTVTELIWKKKTRTDELSFVDDRGKEIDLARGLTWISAVSLSTTVDY